MTDWIVTIGLCVYCAAIAFYVGFTIAERRGYRLGYAVGNREAFDAPRTALEEACTMRLRIVHGVIEKTPNGIHVQYAVVDDTQATIN